MVKSGQLLLYIRILLAANRLTFLWEPVFMICLEGKVTYRDFFVANICREKLAGESRWWVLPVLKNTKTIKGTFL